MRQEARRTFELDREPRNNENSAKDVKFRKKQTKRIIDQEIGRKYVMIDKIEAHQIQDFPAKLSSRQFDSPKALPNNDVDISVRVSYASLVDKAIHVSQADGDAIQRARELLLSGRLESPENIRAAAENIMRFGI